MKLYFLAIAICISILAKAQVTKVYLQASGLTCSMCSNSINRALKTLDFIDKVDADIKHCTFGISFKENRDVDFDRLRKKVENAGFSVSGLIATIYFNNVKVKDNHPVIVGSNKLLLVNLKEQNLSGTRQVKLLDKGFVSSKEYKKESFPVQSPGSYHASI